MSTKGQIVIPENLRENLEVLNQYYIETKYPLDMPIQYSKEESKSAITKAKLVIQTIKDKIELTD